MIRVFAERRLEPGLNRWFLLAIAGLSVGLLVVGSHPPLIIFNASASAPIGFYKVLPALPLTRGDLVLVRTPLSVRALAAERDYLPLTVPLVKRLAAMSGAMVCAYGRAITIDGRHVGDRLSFDRDGRPLPAWAGCQVLAADEVFLLMESVPDSFDSRYFGPVSVAAVVGRLAPLWLR